MIGLSSPPIACQRTQAVCSVLEPNALARRWGAALKIFGEPNKYLNTF